MNRLGFCVAVGMFGMAAILNAANVVREARKIIKDARYEENGDEARKVNERLNGAEKSLLDALAVEKKNKKRAELYYMIAQIQSRRNDIENEKIYLERAYDTVVYYNSIYNCYKYLEKCDSTECSAEGDGRLRFRTRVRRMLLDNRQNLLNGGRFYLRKKNYAEAFRFLELYLSSAGYEALKDDFPDQTDTMYTRVAYWIVPAGYHIGAYEGVVRYAPLALRYDGNRQYVQEYLCRSQLALNDTASWVQELKRGAVNFPDHTYFFTSLHGYLNSNGLYDEALQFADRMIQYDPKNALFRYAKAVTCMRKGDYAGCVADCDVVLMLDSMNADANYFKGLAFCKMAKAASDAMKSSPLQSAGYRKHKAEMVSYYEKAEEPLERMRRLSPADALRWAPLLYQVYLFRNNGAEFDEMEHIIRNLKESDNK